MYLKSLELKGFKSFADRSVLSLEPGITAVVGPNGSGKSNISDAVLWVLGERNARNLRGQAMEDVIFSGSAARKPVSVAEVNLVLDNSDGTLPVDYDEVSITRRMYRSGESEYLINGVVCRRMDVLDILHDSGLGTGTHSIISQGSLDSILQSRPEDRRALIEEAAGVLKHKQRKEKSARKLERMDANLARVRDVTAEVARQLGPLERKAKRALAYQEVSGELADVKLALAVDDLRRLQVEWERVCASEASLAEEIAARREGVAAAEQKVIDIQELIRRESEGAGELAKSHRRASSCAERLDSVEMLLRERKRAALGYEADMSALMDSARAKRAQAVLELEQARAQLAEVASTSDEANRAVEELSQKRAAADVARKHAEAALASAEAQLREVERASQREQARQQSLRDDLSSGLAHEKLVDARKSEIASELTRARAEHNAASRALADAEALLDEQASAQQAAQRKSAEAFDAHEKARDARDAARENAQLHDLEIKSIEKAQRASREEDPALAWLMDHAEQFDGAMAPLSQVLKAPANLEFIVERLLGEDLASLVISDAKAAQSVARALAAGNLSGDVALILRADERAAKAASASHCTAGMPLLSQLNYPSSVARVAEALLGDVVICADEHEAFAAHAKDGLGLRFATADGCVVHPSGKVSLFGKPGDEEGVLARERRLEKARDNLAVARDELAAAEQALADAERRQREAQAESLKASEQLANLKGACEAARNDEQRASQRLAALVREMEDVERQHEVAKNTVSQLQPDVDAIAVRIGELAVQHDELAAQIDEGTKALAPLRVEATRLAEDFNHARLQLATLNERKTYAERIVESRERELAQIERDDAESRRSLTLKQAACHRVEPLIALFEKLAVGLRRRTDTLDAAMATAESASNGFNASASEARNEARAAHEAYDETTAKMTQVRVDKGRLEVQVEAAVNVVVHDCNTPLDHAQLLPSLENRAEAEDTAFKLERRIKNMGVINPDAAAEYEVLKQRYDYLAGQLADMDDARKALAKIVRVIDARIKDDFVSTFEAVNENFSETFQVLFPGGNASLSLEDPDDLEHTGVEVSAQPRGKRITKMMLMSGGEKSLTALALLFAVYKTRSTPFYILDEVEAALDDTNLRRLVAYLDDLRDRTQLIMITHQRRTMEAADVLFGVSMQADGVTKVISQKLERALELAE